jgi:Phage gp6-like head-tail connector protein
MTTWPSLAEVKAWLRLETDPASDPLVEQARLAAIDYVTGRVDTALPGFDPGAQTIPDGVHQACVIYAGRFYRRRDSLDGTIGWGDMGVVRVGVKDNDAEALLARWLKVTVA